MTRNINKAVLIILFAFTANQLFAQTTVQYINLGFGGAAKVSNNGIYVCGNNYLGLDFMD
jgi:hypothetical protein